MTCAKQTVTATIITPDGERFVGTNYCRNPQTTCPRGDMPSGTGYHLCREICDQVGHAEVVALKLAGEKAKGSWLYLEGHTYACADCQKAAVEAGVSVIVIDPPPAVQT